MVCMLEHGAGGGVQKQERFRWCACCNMWDAVRSVQTTLQVELRALHSGCWSLVLMHHAATIGCTTPS